MALNLSAWYGSLRENVLKVKGVCAAVLREVESLGLIIGPGNKVLDALIPVQKGSDWKTHHR